MKLQLLYFKISTPCFFFHMGLTLTLWIPTFSTEESEIKFKLQGGWGARKLKLHLHTSIAVNMKVTQSFLKDLNLFTWSWELSSFKCWHSRSQTLNQKLNLKRFKKKRTNRRSYTANSDLSWKLGPMFSLHLWKTSLP